MDVKPLIPWNRNKTAVTNRAQEEVGPFLALHREMNRLFDDVFHDFDFDIPMSRLGRTQGWPKDAV